MEKLAGVKEYHKFTADDPTPLMPEAHEKTIREIPRDPEVSELFKKLMGAEPMASPLVTQHVGK